MRRIHCTWARPPSRWIPLPPDRLPLRTSVYSASVVATLGTAPNSSSSERAHLDLSRTEASFACTSARSRGWRGGAPLVDGTAQMGLTGRRLRLIPAPAPSRVRASCGAGLLDFRGAACISNIAGRELHAVGVGAAPLTSRAAACQQILPCERALRPETRLGIGASEEPRSRLEPNFSPSFSRSVASPLANSSVRVLRPRSQE